jgi:L-serine dehydratase
MTTPHSLFDVLGPVMIGPSSSHTAGAVRLGLLARAVLGATPESAEITLHGSFASTGHGHGTDLALVAGLLGIAPDDPAIADAHGLAEQAGMRVSIVDGDLGDVHPNTARMLLRRDGRELLMEGSSVGGAEVRVTRIDAFDVEIDGRLPVLLVAHIDRPGEIATVTRILADAGANIAQMRVSRSRRGADALMLIETDLPVGEEVLDAVGAVAAVTDARRIPPV